MAPVIVRRGVCATCGRKAPGIFKSAQLRECEGECPRCGCSPFYLDGVGPWTENIALRTIPEALEIVRSLEDEAEIETLFRVELLGPDRDEVQEALHRRYWEVHDVPPEATSRGKAMTLAELRAAWHKELENPDSRRMYEMLGNV